MRVLVLRKGRAKPLWHGHPWVHADSVASSATHAEPASAPALPDDLVAVRDEEGRHVGYGLESAASLLRVRLLTRAEEPPDVEALLAARLESAVALRRRLLPEPEVTDAYRLVHSEGDGLPGLIVDRFGPLLVAQFATAPMARRREALARHLLALTGATSLVARPGGHEAEEGIDPASVPFATGAAAPACLWVQEDGLRLKVEPLEGQKTGHFADQRENRRLVGGLARGFSVLDLFAGTGGFALQALRSGAADALAVDASARALATAQENAQANGLREGLTVLRGDVKQVLSDLREAGRTFDLVVLDPPSLFPRRGPQGLALKGYRELAVRALTRVKPGGLMATFTCSARLPPTDFLELTRSAARECRAEARVLRELSAGPDHPWALTAPEGRYLSGLLLRVNA